MNDLTFLDLDALTSDPGEEVDLSGAIRASLSAKLERLLQRPLIAKVPVKAPKKEPASTEVDVFDALFDLTLDLQPTRQRAWFEDEDGTFVVPVEIDYRDRWRGYESDVLDEVSGCVEEQITFLTDEQRDLLERSPREFLELHPRPVAVELVDFDTEFIGGADRVLRLRVANRPESLHGLRHVAVVPNLIPLERQLAGLRAVERASDDGPLGPLRALVGVAEDLDVALTQRPESPMPPRGRSKERLDEHQRACVDKALTTPHFAVIQGPPGSGKTTVISTILRRALAAGQSVLVVSPTHVAVDNVVEKLVPGKRDDLAPRSMPVRYASKKNKLSEVALQYWVGPGFEHRAGTIARRLERRMAAKVPLAKRLFAKLDPKLPGQACLTQAVSALQPVICGTPIGILSCKPLSKAEPGSYDLLIVDEVSKMTLPEFLAVAVKAKRWVLVGDPEQLPPYNDPEDNAVTLDDLLPPAVELACSVGSVLERTPPQRRSQLRQVVVAREPDRVASLARSHLATVLPEQVERVMRYQEGTRCAGFVVCAEHEVEDAFRCLTPVTRMDRGHNPRREGSVGLLVERGLAIRRPTVGEGMRLVEPRLRAGAALFDKAGNAYHAQPWSERAGLKLQVVMFRHGLNKALPSVELLHAAAPNDPTLPDARRAALLRNVAERFAVNTVSVYDWLTGMPTGAFDCSPLQELEGLNRADLAGAVAPYTGTLKLQYRMRPSLSAVPRELFYFGEALLDGAQAAEEQVRVRQMQVHREPGGSEANHAEADAILRVIEQLGESSLTARQVRVMLITPYRA